MVGQTQARWEHFPHEADVGVRGVGPTLEAAFAQAALALVAVITDPAGVRQKQSVGVSCTAPDRELLLVDWLNRVVYEMASGGLVFGRFVIDLEGDRLTGTLYGEPVDVARHGPAVEVKGATYTALRVAEEDGSWIAQCVVDV